MSIKLIVGLGNIGTEYEYTRHNAGFWLIDELAKQWNVSLREEKKFFGDVARARYHGEDIWLLKPNTYMNLSGKAVGALAQFYKIQSNEILVVHDELDIGCGKIRFKLGGGNGGLKRYSSQIGYTRFLPFAFGHRTPWRPQFGRQLCVEQTQRSRTRFNQSKY